MTAPRGVWLVMPAETMGWGGNAFQPPYVAAGMNEIVSELRAMHMKYCRTGIVWTSMQSAIGGPITFTTLDIFVNQLLAAGITPILALSYWPNFANGGLGLMGVPVSPSTAFDNFVSYATAFMVAVVQRYGATCIYEVGNEMGSAGSGFWFPNGSNLNTPSCPDFCTLFASIWRACKGVNANITMITGGLTALTFWSGTNAVVGTTYVPQMLTILDANGITPDGVGIHPYGPHSPHSQDPKIDNYPTENSLLDIGRIQDVMTDGGWGRIPVWVTECFDFSAARCGSEAIKAGYMVDAVTLLRTRFSPEARGPNRAGVKVVCMYQLRNNSNGTSDTTDDGLYTGTPVTGPNQQLASGAAFAALIG